MNSNVKIKSDGTIIGTKVTVSGREIKGVTSITFTADAKGNVTTACITVIRPEVDVVAQRQMLMSAENPKGHKLEELMVQLAQEINAKNDKLIDDKSDIAVTVRAENMRIVKAMNEIRNAQLWSNELRKGLK